MSAPELKPCPFCGGNFIQWSSNGFGKSYEKCSDCGATGPGAFGINGNAKGWNTRATSEADALRAENRKLALQIMSSDGQAIDAYEECKHLKAENERLRDGIESVRQYSSDTLIGPSKHADDTRDWQRQAVSEVNNRCRLLLAGYYWDSVDEGDTPAYRAALKGGDAEAPAQPKPDAVQELVWQEVKEQGVTYHKLNGFVVHKVVDRFGTGSNWVCHWPGYKQRRWCKTLDEAKDVALRALAKAKEQYK